MGNLNLNRQRSTGPSAVFPNAMRPYSFAAVLVVLAVVILPVDGELADPENLAFRGDVRKMIGLAEIFAHGFGVLVIAVGIFKLVPAARRLIPRIALCALAPAMVVNGIKICIGRFRPIRYFDEFSIARFPSEPASTFVGWMPYDQFTSAYAMQSFPSAHAATVWGLAIGMTWAFPRGRGLFLTIAVLASVQRVMAYAHWPSDVLVGTAIAFCFAGALTQSWGLGRWLERWESRDARPLETVPSQPAANSPASRAA